MLKVNPRYNPSKAQGGFREIGKTAAVPPSDDLQSRKLKIWIQRMQAFAQFAFLQTVLIYTRAKSAKLGVSEN